MVTSKEVPAHATTVADGGPHRSEFHALYRAHFAYVWRTLARYGVPSAGLEDAAQDVFIVVLRRPGAWHDRASFRSWLHGVARRVASAHRRRQSRHQHKLEALPRVVVAPAIDERVADRQRLDALQAAIERLEPKRRVVFILSDIEGLSAPEIADTLGCKLNTVYSRLRRARGDIHADMARYYGDHDG